MSRMPTEYQSPLGIPLSWQHEVSGELSAAVAAYLNYMMEGSEITPAQITLVRDFLRYFIEAPCWWREDVFEEQLKELRESAARLDSPEAIDAWIWRALDIGIDPL